MRELYIKHIASLLGIQSWQVENCVELFADGCTIPFISRYRKERTGGLTDVEVAEVKHWADVFEEMEKRKASILKTIAEQDKLTAELQQKIENCVNGSELEDLYLPYRPKRKTRATVAVAKGLEPLADLLWTGKSQDPRADARRFVKGEVKDVEDALQGARDIVAERLSETAVIRENLRGIYRTRRVVSKVTKAGESTPEAAKYRTYFNFSMPVGKIPAHNLLAILRAQEEGFLRVEIDADGEKCANKMYYDFCQEHGYPQREAGLQVREAVEDAWKRLLDPSITGEVLREMRKAQRAVAQHAARNHGALVFAPLLRRFRVAALEELAERRFAHAGRTERKDVVRQLNLHHVRHHGVVSLVHRRRPFLAGLDELRERAMKLFRRKLVGFRAPLVEIPLLVNRIGDVVVH